MRSLTMRCVVGLTLALVSACVVVAPAFADGAWWQITGGSRPTHLPPGGEGTIVVRATNLGDEEVSPVNVPVKLAYTLPPGIEATSIFGQAGSGTTGYSRLGEVSCTIVPSPTCSWPGPDALHPYEMVEMTISVKVKADARSGPGEASVSGGEAYRCEKVESTGNFITPFCRAEDPITRRSEEASPPGTGNFEARFEGAVPGASSKRIVTVDGSPTPFGLEDYRLTLEDENGLPQTQAGAHPFQMTTTVALNENAEGKRSPALPKDFSFNLPAGLIGNAVPFPRCTDEQFSVSWRPANLCPADTAVGVASVTIALSFPGNLFSPTTYVVPLFNLFPAPGEPARFGFEVNTAPVLIDTSVRTGRDYGIVATVHNTTEIVSFLSSRVTLWGVPGDPRHDLARGWSCIAQAEWNEGDLAPCTQPLGESNTPPLLTQPTSCTGPLQSTAEVDSWSDPTPLAPFPSEPMSSMDGCNRLPFDASIGVAPDVQEASTATGLTVKVHVPQDASLAATGLGEAAVKDTTVTLPEGVTLNPAGADGLEACSEQEIGYLPGESTPPGELIFTSGLPAPREAPAQPFCPDASKIGTVKIKLPILAGALEGSVYLAAQNANPFGSLVAIYLVAEEPVSGVLVKLPGEVSLTGTGQIVTRFRNSPQAPAEDIELHFFGGDRAPLSTPPLCGSYTTSAQIVPWSGNAPIDTSSTFHITSGPNGGPCPNPPGDQSLGTLPFAPSLTAGTTSNQAGGFSPFTMTMSREDGNQNLKAVVLHMPPGLLGIVSSVTPCGEDQANAGTCGQASLLGHTVVSVGLGSNPFSVTGGEVFLTGPYKGSPYGLSIVNPAKAGPFDLGKVVVRAKIEVDPLTANLTVTTDTSGEHAIPQILDGIPLQIKHINVTIDRPGFIFNATDCSKLALTGTLTSDQGATAGLDVGYQATNCAVLGFKPKLTTITSGRASRKNGTSLAIKIAYPKEAIGKEAWFRTAKFAFPKQLPARLTTLQKACPAATFDANPAACPPQSKVGTAIVHTPVLPAPLSGDVYFVSYGGAKFPEAVIVLQGDNVTVDLHAETFISKTGVTSATLRNIPGVPFENVEVKLPAGPYSEFAATGNLCTNNPKMSTAFTAQNGALLSQKTSIEVQGCPYALGIAHRAVRKRTLTLKVSVPVAGRLVASGKGVSLAAASAKGREIITLTLKEGHAGKLRTKVLLRLTPAKGKQRKVLRKSITVAFG